MRKVVRTIGLCLLGALLGVSLTGCPMPAGSGEQTCVATPGTHESSEYDYQNPAPLDFGVSLTELQIEVWNCTTTRGSLNSYTLLSWTAIVQGNVPWLWIGPQTGQSRGQDNPDVTFISVRVDRSKLPPEPGKSSAPGPEAMIRIGAPDETGSGGLDYGGYVYVPVLVTGWGHEEEGEGEGEPPFLCPQPCEITGSGIPRELGLTQSVSLVYQYVFNSNAFNSNAFLADKDYNGIPDGIHARLLDKLIENASGQTYGCVEEALFSTNFVVSEQLLDNFVAPNPAIDYTTALIFVAGLATIGEPGSFEIINDFLIACNCPEVVGSWVFDSTANQYLGAHGDADLDGVCNLAEWNQIAPGYALDVEGSARLFEITALSHFFTINGGGCCPPCFVDPYGICTSEGEGEGEAIIAITKTVSPPEAGSITLNPTNSPGLAAGYYYSGAQVTATVAYDDLTWELGARHISGFWCTCPPRIARSGASRRNSAGR